MTDELDDLIDELGLPEDDEPDEDSLEEGFRRWYAQLPDFVRLHYPLDIPPDRLPAVRELFDTIGAWRFCPRASCGRGRTCRGGDGPPCFRADRQTLSKVLFITWFRIFWDLSEEEWQHSFRFCAPRYAEDEEAEPAEPKKRRREAARRTAPKTGGVRAARGS